MTADEVILLYHPARSSENLDCFRDIKKFTLWPYITSQWEFQFFSLQPTPVHLSNYFLTKDMCIGDVISVKCLH